MWYDQSEMKLSSSEEYGLRCILQLARSHGKGLATVEEIARREGMSTPYVEKLLLQLKKGGLVTSLRGAAGGYELTKSPKEMSVGTVLRALDGTLLDDLCDRFPGENESCVHLRQCQIRPVWVVLAHHLYKILDQISLADLLASEGEGDVRRELYHRFPIEPIVVR